MDWNDLQVFCVAAGSPTLTEAARRLKMSVSTVSRRIDSLEASSGLHLFHRSVDGISLTTHGVALHDKARGAFDCMVDIEQLAASLRQGGWPDPIRITATEPVITEVLAPALPLLLGSAPEVRVDLVAESEIVSLSARTADIALRFAEPKGNDLVVKRLPSIRMGLFTSNGYIAGRSPDALRLGDEQILGYDDSMGFLEETRWLVYAGLQPRVVARSSSTLALVAAVSGGAGIAVLPSRIAERAGLIRLPTNTPIKDRKLWMMTHRSLVNVKPMKIVRDWIETVFQIDGKADLDRI